MTSKTLCDMNGFRKFLKKNELKATSQRLAVHQAMMELGHACADDVVEFIREKEKGRQDGERITKASVYNILRDLAGLGLYGYRMSRTNKMFFDVRPYEHPHMYDVENHCYRDIIDDDLVSIVDDFLGRKKFKGYTVEGIDIQIIVRPTRRRYKTASGMVVTQVSSAGGRKKIASRTPAESPSGKRGAGGKRTAGSRKDRP